jgi:Type VI secretion system/phage-baseplate injector OB domain
MDRIRFYGKYKDIVTNSDDPSRICRIHANVPSVYGEQELGWALPCLPFPDKNMANRYMPQVGSLVWIEFEEGNPQSPIWTGCSQ